MTDADERARGAKGRAGSSFSCAQAPPSLALVWLFSPQPLTLLLRSLRSRRYNGVLTGIALTGVFVAPVNLPSVAAVLIAVGATGLFQSALYFDVIGTVPFCLACVAVMAARDTKIKFVQEPGSCPEENLKEAWGEEEEAAVKTDGVQGAGEGGGGRESERERELGASQSRSRGRLDRFVDLISQFQPASPER